MSQKWVNPEDQALANDIMLMVMVMVMVMLAYRLLYNDHLMAAASQPSSSYWLTGASGLSGYSPRTAAGTAPSCCTRRRASPLPFLYNLADSDAVNTHPLIVAALPVAGCPQLSVVSAMYRPSDHDLVALSYYILVDAIAIGKPVRHLFECLESA